MSDRDDVWSRKSSGCGEAYEAAKQSECFVRTWVATLDIHVRGSNGRNIGEEPSGDPAGAVVMRCLVRVARVCKRVLELCACDPHVLPGGRIGGRAQ